MTLSLEDRTVLVRFRFEQMDTAAESCRLLLGTGDLQGAANRLYYSVFYAISALALMNEKNFSKHGALIGWFNKEYVGTGKIDRIYGRFVNTAWKNRTRGDYQFMVNLTREELADSIKILEKFISCIRSLM